MLRALTKLCERKFTTDSRSSSTTNKINNPSSKNRIKFMNRSKKTRKLENSNSKENYSDKSTRKSKLKSRQRKMKNWDRNCLKRQNGNHSLLVWKRSEKKTRRSLKGCVLLPNRANDVSRNEPKSVRNVRGNVRSSIELSPSVTKPWLYSSRTPSRSSKNVKLRASRHSSSGLMSVISPKRESIKCVGVKTKSNKRSSKPSRSSKMKRQGW